MECFENIFPWWIRSKLNGLMVRCFGLPFITQTLQSILYSLPNALSTCTFSRRCRLPGTVPTWKCEFYLRSLIQKLLCTRGAILGFSVSTTWATQTDPAVKIPSPGASDMSWLSINQGLNLSWIKKFKLFHSVEDPMKLCLLLKRLDLRGRWGCDNELRIYGLLKQRLKAGWMRGHKLWHRLSWQSWRLLVMIKKKRHVGGDCIVQQNKPLEIKKAFQQSFSVMSVFLCELRV